MSKSTEPVLCLVMILGNESHVIKRALDTMSPHIDYWVIHCNGSDETADIVEAYFKEKGIPGELERNEWVDFGTNRSQVMKAAKGKAKYLLLPDADFILVPKTKNFKEFMRKSRADAFEIKYEGSLDYRQTLCVSGKLDWKYVGMTHEYITCDDQYKLEMCDWFTFDHLADGGERADKFPRDIRLCMKGLEKEPNNTRYMFYCANSHRDLGHRQLSDGNIEEGMQNLRDAIKMYERRASYTDTWFEETYCALLDLVKLKLKLQYPIHDVMNDAVKAFTINPGRLEALYQVVRLMRAEEKYHLGYQIGRLGAAVKYPKDQKLFIDAATHDYLFHFEYAICCSYTGHSDESVSILTQLIDDGKMPAHYQEQAKKNLQIALTDLNRKRLEQLALFQKQKEARAVPISKATKNKKRGR